jgi:hypothetical protein
MMKNKRLTQTVFVFFFLLFTFHSVNSQTLSQLINDIKGKVIDVQIDKIQFKQTLEILNESKGKLRFTSAQVDEKGTSTTMSYEFYLSDLDKNTIIRKTEGKKLIVSMSVVDKQKFVKCNKNEKLFAYDDNVDILMPGSDAAQFVIDKVKAAIPLVKNSEYSWASSKDALTWLCGHIKQVEGKNGACIQSLTIDPQRENLLTFSTKSTDSKGITVDEVYNFNIQDVNKTQVVVRVSGTSLSVQIGLKNEDKFIRYSKNNALQNFVNNLEILADDVDQARDIVAALTFASEKCKMAPVEFKTSQSAVDFLKKNIGSISFDSKSVKQQIDIVSGNGGKSVFTSEETDSRGKVVKNSSEFYLSDIEPASVNFKVSGKKVQIVLTVVNKTKLIKISKDDILQGYDYDVTIEMSDIEIARQAVAAFGSLIKASELAPAKYAKVADAMIFLENNVKGETIGNEKYEITFEGDYTDPFSCNLKVVYTDSKGIANETGYLIYPNTLDPASVHVECAGKYLSVVANTKGKKQWVKKLRKERNSYISEFEIMTFDAKMAHDISEALKYILNTAFPKEMKWDTQKAALAFVKENIGDLAGNGKEVKQKFEFSETDPCKITFTVNTTDNNGKTIEEIFEFNLSDMNKLMVDFTTQSGNTFINLVCKNRQKLVKVYKNGTQQAYGSEIEITDDDVDTASRMVEALKTAIIKCEQ